MWRVKIVRVHNLSRFRVWNTALWRLLRSKSRS